MERKSVLSFFTAMVLAFCVSFGGAAAMVTGLALNAEFVPLALGCLLVAAACAFCSSLRRGGWIALGIWSLALLVSVVFDDLRQHWLSLLGSAFDYYDRAYYIGIPKLFDVSRALDHGLPLMLISGLVSMVMCQTVIRRWPVALSVFLAILPLAACFVVTDTPPALWCLLLWLFGMLMLLLSHPVRQRDRLQGDKLTAMLALPVALGLWLLTLAAPQEGYQPPIKIDSFEDFVGWVSSKLPYVGQTSDGELVFNLGGGVPDRVKLDKLGRRKLPNTPVMEVNANFFGKVYLRGIDMDSYDGLSWSASDQREESDFFLPEAWAEDRGRLEIRVLGSRGYRYVPYWPGEQTYFQGGQMANDGYSREYGFDVTVLAEDWELQYELDGADGPAADRIYLALPGDTAKEAKKILRAAGISDLTDPVAIAKAVENYVRRTAEYDLDPDVMPGSEEDLAIWFLREAERGYCVHFATSAAVLLRAAGVPARYVEGYTAEAVPNRVTVVRANKAHAWVEYYVPGIGWMVIDPTPGEEGATVTDPTETEPTITEPTETEPTITEPTETEPPTDPTSPTETDPTESLTIVLPTATAPVQTTTAPPATTEAVDKPEEWEPESFLPDWFWWILSVFCTMFVFVVAAIGQWLIRRRWKLARMYGGRVNAQALARYREAKRMAKLRNVPLPDKMTELAEKACYSRQGITTEELARFEPFLRESTDALSREGLLKSLYYRLILAVI
ncbi:MAG: transglutaminase domain-containing protein [Oscillospiraceae bacterium]|nr:transglutaminase domain-containing protein [Oscillospiraceae bacterium]